MSEPDLILMSVLIFLPLAFAAGLLFFPKGSEEYMRWWSLFGTAATLVVSIWIFIDYQQNVVQGYSDTEARRVTSLLTNRADQAEKRAAVADPPLGYDFVAKYPWIPRFNIEYFLGLDGISLALVLLTTGLSFLAMWASWKIDRYVRGYCILVLLLETGMIGTFVALEFFL